MRLPRPAARMIAFIALADVAIGAPPRSSAWRSTDAGAKASISAASSASARAELSPPRLQT